MRDAASPASAPISSAMNALRRSAARIACATPLQDWTLGGGRQYRILPNHPVDPWAGNPSLGRQFLEGKLDVGGLTLDVQSVPNGLPGLTEAWLDAIHGFWWLRDLKALGGDTVRRRVRDLIETWITRYGRWEERSWKPARIGNRLAAWVAFYDFYGASADDGFQLLLAGTLARQARYLARTLPGRAEGLDLLHAARGLIYAGLALENQTEWLEQGLTLLTGAIGRQVLEDGCHVSRSPARMVEILQMLVELRCALTHTGYACPPAINTAIERMGPALRALRHGDRGCALFNGAREIGADSIDILLARAGARGRTPKTLPDGGYERLSVGRGLVLIDTGTPPPPPFDTEAHAAPLAFEFSYGGERLIVNCGAHPIIGSWRDVLRGTAAHSTLIADGRDAAEIRENGQFGRRPRRVMVTRNDAPGAALVEASHDGYVSLSGLSHNRRLYLSGQGGDFRGEDTISGNIPPSRPLDITLRFHLHPQVAAALTETGSEVLLKAASGTIWRFHHSGGNVSLEDSIYIGPGLHPQKTSQIVLRTRFEEGMSRVKWAFHRK